MCLNFDINTVISILSLIINFCALIIMIGIYKLWEKQKRKEVTANDADMLINDIIHLGEKVFYINTYSPKERSDIEYVIESQIILKFKLEMLAEVYPKLNYKEYIDSIGDIVVSWNNNQNSTKNIIKNSTEKTKLLQQLKDLKLYYCDIK